MKVWLPWFLLSYPFSLQTKQGVFCTFLCLRTSYATFRKNLQSRILSAKRTVLSAKSGGLFRHSLFREIRNRLLWKWFFWVSSLLPLGYFLFWEYLTSFRKALKLSGLTTCSSLQASDAAVVLSTPRFSSISQNTQLRS